MMKHSVPVFVAVLAAVALFASTAAAQNAPPAAAPSMKIAVVDLQRAVEQTEDGLRAVSTIKKLFESRQQQLARSESDLLKKKEELDKKKNAKTISAADYDRSLDELKKQLMELQQMSQDYDRELYKKRKELTDPILERVVASIKRIANNEGYDIVLDKPSAVFVRSDLDLTDRVIQMANAMGPNQGAAPPKTGTTPPAAPPAAPPKK
jgi:outer membrane protein